MIEDCIADSEPLPVNTFTTPLGNTSWKIFASSINDNGVEEDG